MNDTKKMIELVEKLAPKFAKELRLFFKREEEISQEKKTKQVKFLKEERKGKIYSDKERLKILYAPFTITQALRNNLPLKEPSKKTNIIREEPKPFLFEVEERFGEKKFYQPIKTNTGDQPSIVEELPLEELVYVPERIYLQRLDDDNRKILVKMYVDFGYLDSNKFSLFLDPVQGEIADCMIHLVTLDHQSLGLFPLKHSSNFFVDTEQIAHPLFIGQITGLDPNQKYRYRIECYRNDTGELFAGTAFKTFRTAFALKERNSPFFFTIASDLHGGREAGFLKGKVKRRKIRGNKDLEKVFKCLAETEQKVTFDEGYSLSIVTGDLTENASYPEYWADLFKCCSPLWDHVPLITSIGNHDYYTGGIGRGNKLGGLEEDCRYWHRYITNPYTKRNSQLGHWYSLDMGNAHLVFLDALGKKWGKFDISCESEQWLWLENDLRTWREQINADKKVPQFCFVFLHPALMSLGFWGRGFNNGNDEQAQSYLTPLFRKYGVDMVFFGHDHIYQRSHWMNTHYLTNGRSGGTARPYWRWLKNRAIYDVDRIVRNRKTRVYTSLYVPPNPTFMTAAELTDFRAFKHTVKEQLLAEPTESFYFFGKRECNQKIGQLFDKEQTNKEQLIEELIIPKLVNHAWLRAYAVEDHYTPNTREIIDMLFFKPNSMKDFDPNSYSIICPEKIVE
ncbi:MAG: hypothetical protein GF308_08380 [Candidatus Heimdallarchaeota archaeon]|nr:hypothetical protein [Candidatus Heimdallarchaeota archaeon]